MIWQWVDKRDLYNVCDNYGCNNEYQQQDISSSLKSGPVPNCTQYSLPPHFLLWNCYLLERFAENYPFTRIFCVPSKSLNFSCIHDILDGLYFESGRHSEKGISSGAQDFDKFNGRGCAPSSIETSQNGHRDFLIGLCGYATRITVT